MPALSLTIQGGRGFTKGDLLSKPDPYVVVQPRPPPPAMPPPPLCPVPLIQPQGSQWVHCARCGMEEIGAPGRGEGRADPPETPQPDFLVTRIHHRPFPGQRPPGGDVPRRPRGCPGPPLGTAMEGTIQRRNQ